MGWKLPDLMKNWVRIGEEICFLRFRVEKPKVVLGFSPAC